MATEAVQPGWNDRDTTRGTHDPAAARWGGRIDPDAELGALVDDDGDGPDVLTAGDLHHGDGDGQAGHDGAVDAHLIPLPSPTLGQRLRLVAASGQDPVPAWVGDGASRRQVAAAVRRDAVFLAKVGAVHSPRLAGKSALWSLRGAVVLGWRLARWVYDIDGHPLAGKVQASDDKQYVRMAELRSKRQRFRFLLLVFLALIATGGVLFVASVSKLLLALVLAGMVAVLAWAGKPQGATLASPALAAQTQGRPRLTSLQIVRALQALGMPTLTRALDGDSSRIWRSPISATRGGFKVHLQLPVGVLAAELVAHEQRIAAALGRPADTVVVEPHPNVTPGDLTLWIMDKPLLASGRGPGPLAKAKRANWWQPVQVGVTRIGTVHTIALRGGAWFVGGQPSSGKSSLLRVAAAHTALDPTALLLISNLKGSPDYAALRPVCHTYVNGSPESDPTVIPRTTAMLRWVLDECARRNDLLTRLVEEGKASSADVTADLAKARPGDFAPVTVVLDEVHRLFDKTDNPEAEEAAELFGKVIKAVRSVAITVIAATQLAGSESVPPVVTRAARIRGCLKVQDEVSWRQIFGNAGKGSFATSGVATLAAGTVILKAEDGGALKVGTFYIEPTHLAEIGKRALQLRTDLHTLTGEAAGEAPTEVEPVDPAALLRHVLDALPTTAPTGTDDNGVAWVHALEEALSAREEYTGRSAGWLTPELRSRKVDTRPVNRRVPDPRTGGTRQVNRPGVRSVDVRRALIRLVNAATPHGDDEDGTAPDGHPSVAAR